MNVAIMWKRKGQPNFFEPSDPSDGVTLMAYPYFRRRDAISESAEDQPASNGWPGRSMSMTSGA
jgi:hypothetical protein